MLLPLSFWGEFNVKPIKYFTSFLLLFITFIFIGEIYVWHLANFETEYKYVTFYIQDGISHSEMLTDIYHTAKETDINVFVVEKEVTSLFSENIHIYGTADTFSKLSAYSELESGLYESIFLGKINVSYHNWNAIPDINRIENYYVIGDDEDITNFKVQLVNKYAGRFPQEGYQTIHSKLSIGIVWACVLVFLLLLTFYEVAQQKKNTILRITIGEQISHFVFKNTFMDLFVYSLIFIAVMLSLGLYTNTFYLKEYTILFWCIFLLANSFIYIWLFFTDYKKDIQTQKSAQNILKISYVYKMITSVMIIITMTGCIELIYNGINYYRQSEFFKTHKNYSYITVGGTTVEKALEMLNAYYSNGREHNKMKSLVDLGKWETNAEYILADQGVIDYLYSCIPELQHIDLEERIYFLIPEKYINNEHIVEEMTDICYSYYHTNDSYDIIGYKNTAWVMALSNTGSITSTLKRNPIIILNNISSFTIPDSRILYIGNSTMYSFSEEEFEAIATANNYDYLHYRTNVYENYLYFWNIKKRNMLMGSVLLFILLLLEGLILKTILKYEYQLNAKELLLNKIHGNGFFSRHKRISLILFSSWVSLFITIIICKILAFSATLFILIGGALIISLEHLFVMIYSNKLNHINISKIFKGGTL